MALKRHRMTVIGKHARAYDPSENRQAKQNIAWWATQAMTKARIKALLDGPIAMTCTFYLRKPKSRIRKNSTPYPYPDTKPDLDNLAKTVLDALNGVVYRDDAQICALTLRKRYTTTFGPMTEIKIQRLACDANV